MEETRRTRNVGKLPERTSKGSVLLATAAVCIAMVALPGSATGAMQQTDSTVIVVPVPVAQAPQDQGISPRGAMLRSIALWGWGQAAVGSYTRGGVWFAMEGGTAFMLFRTLTRLNQIKVALDRAETFATDSLNMLIATDSLEAERLSDPLVFEQAVAEGPGVAVARKLVDARTQQRQDWITYAIFFTMMSGVDAYVNAHLHNFPTTIASEMRRDGSVSLSVRFPLPAWLGGSHRGLASGSLPALPIRRY